jgi:CRP-like cAMP-binding protein
MRALKEQTIIRQGEPGHEMYIIMNGEVEVTVRDDTVPHIDAGQQKQRRLGFLSEGAFFGEAPVLAARDDTSMQLRMRTVRAVANSELCFLTRNAVYELCDEYPELKARLLRFRNASSIINDKTLQRIGMSRAELSKTARDYKKKLVKTEHIRREMNLDERCYVTAALLPSNPFTLARAKARFKRRGGGNASQSPDLFGDEGAGAGGGEASSPTGGADEQLDELSAFEAQLKEDWYLEGEEVERHQGQNSALGELQALLQAQDLKRHTIERKLLASIEAQATRQARLEEQTATMLAALSAQVTALASAQQQ